jgi:hypothetical protein
MSHHPLFTQVEPGQHPTQMHHDTCAAQRTMLICIAHTLPTAACGVDPHTQTIWYVASLTPHPPLPPVSYLTPCLSVP